jgi:hypothetical protein
MKKNEMLKEQRSAFRLPYKTFMTFLTIGVILVVLYYLWTRGFVYLNFSKSVYTDYFWNRATWLLVHVICGLIATITGCIQLIPAVRTSFPRTHRNMGKIYLGCIVISTAVSFYLVSTAQLGLVYQSGLAMLGITWLCSTGMAYFSILKGNVVMHKEWMIKSYVLTLSFVSFRFVEDFLAKCNISNFVDRKVLLAWASWAIPFFFTELLLQLKRMQKNI